MRLTNSHLIPCIVLASAAVFAFGCDQQMTGPEAGAGVSDGGQYSVDQDALTAAEINTFFAQDVVELTLHSLERPESTQGIFEVPLTHGRMQVEVLFQKEMAAEQFLAERLFEGERQIAIKLSDVGGFQAHSSLGDYVIHPAEVGEFLIDTEVPTICGTRKTATLAVIEHDGDEIAAMLALHLVRDEQVAAQSDASSDKGAKGGTKGKKGIKAQATKAGAASGPKGDGKQGPQDQEKPKPSAKPVLQQKTDCGDDWKFLWGTPDCKGTCHRVCKQVTNETDIDAIGGCKIGPGYGVLYVNGVAKCFQYVNMTLSCQVYDGWFSNSCECARCPKP